MLLPRHNECRHPSEYIATLELSNVARRAGTTIVPYMMDLITQSYVWQPLGPVPKQGCSDHWTWLSPTAGRMVSAISLQHLTYYRHTTQVAHVRQHTDRIGWF